MASKIMILKQFNFFREDFVMRRKKMTPVFTSYLIIWIGIQKEKKIGKTNKKNHPKITSTFVAVER